MAKIKIKIPRLFLEGGRDLYIADDLHCKHPTLQEILDIDEKTNGFRSQEIYDSYISIFLTDPYDYMVFLDDRGIDYEECTPFEVFNMKFNQYMEVFMGFAEALDPDSEAYDDYISSNIYFSSFKFFFGIDHFFSYQDPESKKYLLYYLVNEETDNGIEEVPKLLMDEFAFQYVYEFMRLINGIPESSDKINPEDDIAKKILIEDKRDEEKKRAKKKELEQDDDDDDDDNDRLGAGLSALMWASNGNINPFNKLDLHIYDLTSGTSRFDKFLNYCFAMISGYTGHIELKKINFNKTHWTR